MESMLTLVDVTEPRFRVVGYYGSLAEAFAAAAGAVERGENSRFEVYLDSSGPSIEIDARTWVEHNG